MRLPVASLLPALLLTTLPASAVVETPRGDVTRAEYRKVEKGMSRQRVERIFDTGRGCLYVKYELDDVLFTGRQYRNANGYTVSIRFVTRSDGVERVRGKQWDTSWSCGAYLKH
jgi:hypothetical protein